MTGPVSKAAIARSGAPGSEGFLGHTEYLAVRLGVAKVVMAFHGEALTTALVTTHLPLARVAEAITPDAVATTTYWLARFLASLGKHPPRIVVASLNPHAGEGGLLGTEETTQIIPGVDVARARLAERSYCCRDHGPSWRRDCHPPRGARRVRRRSHDVPRPGDDTEQAPRVR